MRLDYVIDKLVIGIKLYSVAIIALSRLNVFVLVIGRMVTVVILNTGFAGFKSTLPKSLNSSAYPLALAVQLAR
jgi:hypothetical protein